MANFNFCLPVLYLIFLIQSSLNAQEEICMFYGVLSKYKIIEEEEYFVEENNEDGSIITRTSHNLGLEKSILQNFNLKVNVEWYDDSNGFNAFATSEVTDSTKTDGTILLGKNLLNAIGYNGFKYIILHEVAHIADYKYKLELLGKNEELFADFVAGFILGYDHCSSLLNDIDLIIFGFKTLEESLKQSDDRKEKAFGIIVDFIGAGDFNFNSTSHHGTGEERMKALTLGYNLGFTELKNANDFMGELFDNEVNEKDIMRKLNDTFENYNFLVTGYKSFEAKPVVINLYDVFNFSFKRK